MIRTICWLLLLPAIVVAEERLVVNLPGARPKPNTTVSPALSLIGHAVPTRLLVRVLMFHFLNLQQNHDKFAGVDPRIIGGEIVDPVDRYPFAASLVTGGFHGCGGSLIAPNVVLSAAHCGGSFSSVEIGRYDRDRLVCIL